MTRRNFIKLSGLTAAALSPMARIGSAIGATGVASTQLNASATFSDYKALVVVFLDGGNDSMNMVVPTADTAHGHYTAIRGVYAVDAGTGQATNAGLGISKTDLDPNLTVGADGHFLWNSTDGQPYKDAPSTNPSDDALADQAIRSYRKGVYDTTETTNNGNGTYTNTATKTGLGINSMMPEIAAMYKKGKVSIVTNVGTLVNPITRTQVDAFDAGTAADGSPIPPVFLFAHNHQKRAVYTCQAEQLGATGWAGKLADAWRVNDPIGLNLTYGDVNRLGIGVSTSPLKMPTDAPVSFETAHREPINRAKGGPFEDLLNRLQTITKTDAFSDYYSNKIKKAGDLSSTLIGAMESKPIFSEFTAKNSYGLDLFSYEYEGVPAKDFTKDIVGLTMHDEIRDGIFQQLRAAAEMIKVGKEQLNHPRQIIYIRMPGFDTHSGQAAHQLNDFRSLSMAMGDFQKAIEEMGMKEEVLTMTLSDFGRTLKNNSDGTDHGWGQNNFVMTGDPSFNGGNVYGTVLDDLSLEGPNSYTKKGRIIPTTSIEQMISPCLKWFGVSPALMPTILPNLANFNGHSNTANLQGMFT